MNNVIELSAVDRLRRLKSKDVLNHYSVSYQTMWRHIKEGHIPRPRYSGLKKPYWTYGDIEDHENKQLSKSNKMSRADKLRQLLHL